MTTTMQIDRAVIEQALEWIQDAAVVLSHVSTAINGGIGAEAEGVGGCSVKVSTDLRTALAESERDWSLLEATQQSLREHMAEIQRLRQALEFTAQHKSSEWPERCQKMVDTARTALAEQPAEQEPVTVLPDGSAFAVMSYPLPKDHWLYADREYNDGEYEPAELGKPVLTHELRDAVVSAVRYAIRCATDCGKEVDFDPDALVQSAVYALCGPFTSQPTKREPLTTGEIDAVMRQALGYGLSPSRDDLDLVRAIERAHGIGVEP